MAENSSTSPLPDEPAAMAVPDDTGEKVDGSGTGTAVADAPGEAGATSDTGNSAETSVPAEKKNTFSGAETDSTAKTGMTPANRNRKKRTALWLRLLKAGGRFLKWFAIIVSVIVLLLLIFRDAIIKSCITGIGSFVAGVEITIDELETSLDGKIRITNLTVGNPDGFKTPHLLQVSSCYLDVDMATLFSDRIILEELDVNELHLTGEYSDNGDFNISEVINDLSKKFSSGNSETKFFINKLMVRNSSVKMCNGEDEIVFDFKSLSGSTTDGKMELSTLTISSPAGFRNQYISVTKTVKTEFDAESVFSDNIKIKTLLINDTRAACEFRNDGASNLQTAVRIITDSDAPKKSRNKSGKENISKPDRTVHSVSIDKFALANITMSISDQRTGCNVEKGPLTIDFENLSFTSSPDDKQNFVQLWIDDFCNTLAGVTFAPNLLKQTFQKTGDFFVDSVNTVIHFFQFK